MAKIKNNYDNSFFAKLKRWINGDYRPFETIPLAEQTDHPPLDERHEHITVPADEVLETPEVRSFFKIYKILSVIVCVILIAVLLVTVSYMPRMGDADNPGNSVVSERYIEKGLEETGATNIVAGMILDYRAFDTFGESCVLFSALCCVFIMLKHDGTSLDKETNDRIMEPKNDTILQKIAAVIVPIMLIFGVYIVLNGHLSAGGGFSGGAVMGSGLILYLVAFGFKESGRMFSEKTFNLLSFISLSFYCLAKSYSFFTGANGIDSHIPLGTPGNILSSGLILPLNICVGIIVACTMYAFYVMFRKGDF